ncbi:MAG TPA: ABC transporter permease [Verrucomicrobiae bacterium]|nr:ABC transporter permease [Verrucomicrobiae bacterium]
MALLVGMQIHFFRQPRLPTRDLIWALTIFFSPVLSGLLVAPWLTLLCRSLLAGIVFTASLPFLFLIMGEFAAQVRFGIGHGTSPETENFKAGVIGLMLLAHWVAGGYLGWRRFMRLEAIEGPIGELHLPRWLRSRSPTTSVALKPKRRHPLWQLLKKELRLQKIVFVTAGLFVVIVLTLWTIHQLRLDLDSAFVDITTVFFIGVVSMLIGAVASAEERQLGTAEWQVLLPMAARQQWAVKVATVLGLAVILAAFLPACVLDRVSWGNEVKAELPSLAIYFAGFAAALATIGLYFSSLCNSGLKAMLISLPAGVGIQWLIGIVRNHHDDGLQAHRAYFGPGPWDWLVTSLPPVLLVGLFLLTLRFAFSNHRSAERSVGRIWRQLGCLIAYVALSAALCYNVLFLYPAADRDNQEEAQSPPSL